MRRDYRCALRTTGDTVQPSHPEDPRDLARRRSGNRPHAPQGAGNTVLPEGTVDARHGDSVRIALLDPLAVLILGDGPNQFTPPPTVAEQAWEELRATGRLIATLVNSGLSSRYWGLFRGGRGAAPTSGSLSKP